MVFPVFGMNVSIEDRHLIVEKTLRENLRPRTIARQLGCSIRKVDRVMQQFMEEHKLEPHVRSGPSMMDMAMTNALDKIVKKTQAPRVQTFKLSYWPRQADE